jgi:hypothetical protein
LDTFPLGDSVLHGPIPDPLNNSVDVDRADVASTNIVVALLDCEVDLFLDEEVSWFLNTLVEEDGSSSPGRTASFGPQNSSLFFGGEWSKVFELFFGHRFEVSSVGGRIFMTTVLGMMDADIRAEGGGTVVKEGSEVAYVLIENYL